MLDMSTIVVILIIFLAIVLIFSAVVTVRQGFEYTVEMFGRYTKR